MASPEEDEDAAPEDEEEPPEGWMGHVVRAWRRVRGRTWYVDRPLKSHPSTRPCNCSCVWEIVVSVADRHNRDSHDAENGGRGPLLYWL